MKMQNASMEFVTFDAQDVIATSGPLTAMFTVNEDIIGGPFIPWPSYDNGKWTFSTKGGSQTLLVNGAAPADGTTWILTEKVSGYTGEIITDAYDTRTLSITGATQAAAGATADETLYSLNKIVEWLFNNGAKQ